MTAPLEGVRVLEVAIYAFVPSAAAILADWGADVLKVEHPVTGDPGRNTAAWGVPSPTSTACPTCGRSPTAASGR